MINEMRPEHYLEMGVDPSTSGLELEELIRRLEKRIRRNNDCSGAEHDSPSTSEVPLYSAAVVAISVDAVPVNNSVNMLLDIQATRRRGGFVR